MGYVHLLVRRGVTVIAGMGLAGGVVVMGGTATAYAADRHAAPAAYGSHGGHGRQGGPATGAPDGDAVAAPVDAASPGSVGSAGSAAVGSAAVGSVPGDSA